MFGMLRMALTLLICVLAVGFYLGWFSFSQSTPDPQSNKVNINVSVDKNKVRNDLQRAEQNLSQRIQEINSQPKGSGTPLPAGQQPLGPRLNFGPISMQTSGPSANGQPAPPTLSIGPFSVQPASPQAAPSSGQPAGQSQEFQFTVPLGVPPPGDGP